MKNILHRASAWHWSSAVFVVFIFFMQHGAAVAAGEAERVANFAVGKYGQKNYEHLGFSVTKNNVAAIHYYYGDDSTTQQLKLLGQDVYQGKKCIRVGLANGLELYIVPSGEKLMVINPKGKYKKMFAWEYEGPVDGRGTFCASCVEEKDAMGFVKKHFLQ